MLTYFLYDGLGSTTDVTDEDGNVVASYGYDVFGEVRTGTPPSHEDAFLFTGEERDWETELYYLRARYYDPEIGRFLTRDFLGGSLGNPQSQHRYAYVRNNPVRYVDPFGLRSTEGGIWIPWWAGAAVGGAAAAPVPFFVDDAIALGVVGGVIAVGTCVLYCDEAIDEVGKLFGNLLSDGGEKWKAPEDTFKGKSGPREAAKGLGLDRRKVGKAVEILKGKEGLRPDDSVEIGKETGDVYDPKTGEVIGNIYDQLPYTK